jgi:hypothetical protein
MPVETWLGHHADELRRLIRMGWNYAQIAEALNLAGIRYSEGRPLPGGGASRGTWTARLLTNKISAIRSRRRPRPAAEPQPTIAETVRNAILDLAREGKIMVLQPEFDGARPLSAAVREPFAQTPADAAIRSTVQEKTIPPVLSTTDRNEAPNRINNENNSSRIFGPRSDAIHDTQPGAVAARISEEEENVRRILIEEAAKKKGRTGN